MDCPVCDNTLKEVHLALPTSNKWDDMEVDVCEGGCGGFWFDRFELDKVDEPDEIAGEELLDTPHDSTIEIDHEADRDCPSCDGVTMIKRFMSVHQEVEIDECGGCAGVWLDAGELEDIRQQFDSEEEREAAFDEYYREELAADLKARETESAEDNAFLKALRFVCPTYWIPGDQSWGAH